MSKQVTKEQKQAIVQRYLNGESVAAITRETQISRSTLYLWIRESQVSQTKKVQLKDLSRLKMQYERSQRIAQILQTAPCTASAPLREKLDAIVLMSKDYNVNILCDALKVAKGTYYNHILRNKRENTVYAKRKAELKPIIEEIFHKSRETYGSSKITAIMKDRGYAISEKTVADIMHENGLFSVRSSAKTLYVQQQKRRENLLNRQFSTSRPNEVWVSDVTYFHLHNKTYYICAVLDLYSRKAIAYRISLKNSTQLTKGTFKLAYQLRKPQQGLIFHSDNGSNYVSKNFTAYLRQCGVVQSYSKKKTPYDNSVCESFFGSMKQEELYRSNYRSEKELYLSIVKYIARYNDERPHSFLRYMTPIKFEELYYSYHPNELAQASSDLADF